MIAYISTQDQCEGTPEIPAGSLVLKGRAFIGANPDPDARRTELIIYDDFEDEEFSDCPTAYSHRIYYNSCPEWDPVSGSGDWEVLSDSTWVLRNKGTFVSQQHIADKIAISQPQTDLDVNLDFKYSMGNHLEIAFRETSAARVYVEVDPNSQKVRLFNSSSPTIPIDEAETDLDPDTWYEMHIRCRGQNVDVWLRPRDVPEPPPLPPWRNLIHKYDSDQTVLTGDQLYFSLRVEHNVFSPGRYRFDNVILNYSTQGGEPELECSGCAQ